MKKALRVRQTLRAGGAKNVRPAADPLPGGAGRPKFNQLETVTTCTYRPSLVRIDAHEFRVIVVTDPQTNKATNKHANRQDRLQYTASLFLARSITAFLTAMPDKAYSNHGLSFAFSFICFFGFVLFRTRRCQSGRFHCIERCC